VISAAAEELGFTQSAASQQLAAFEREAGLTLVDRGARPLRLTEAGGLILRHAQGVLGGFTGMESAIAELHGLAQGGVRLVAFASALASVVPPAVAEFARRHPDVAVDIALAEPIAAASALRAGAGDLAIMYRMEAAPDDGLRRRILFRDPLNLVLPEDHQLAATQADPVRRSRRYPDGGARGRPRRPSASGPDRAAVRGRRRNSANRV
jgi:DNA-binding transcriptional LysR family regulator